MSSHKKKFKLKKRTIPDTVNNYNNTFGIKSSHFNGSDDVSIGSLVKGVPQKDYLEEKLNKSI